jgi:hypothetical protein
MIAALAAEEKIPRDLPSVGVPENVKRLVESA